MQFLSRKKPRQLFWIPKKSIKVKDGKVDLFVRRLKQDSTLVIKNRDNRRLPVSNDASAKVLFDKGRYYLVLLISEEEAEFPVGKNDSIALDPGVRTFQTGYSPTGQIYKFGENQAELVKKLHSRIDKLKSDMTDKKYKTRYNIKRRLAKLDGKVRDIIDNLHNQCGYFLAKNYDTVLLPSFGTSKMQESDTLCSVVKRRMNSLAHYRFQQKLSYLCQKYYSKLVIVDESYTTKTCGGCGLIREDVGSDKIYTCKNCHYCLDRDVHGARNIWLKNS
jgi:putative transposase